MNNKEKYTNELKIALIGFTKCEDWIDFINCLNRVEKILNNNIENHMIVLAPSLVKRLNQCLNPILSPSVHKSCLGIYKLFTKLPKESLIEQFPLLTVGLFEFSLDCKYLISEYYLKIIEEYIRIATNVDFERIQLSLFPFLEENLGEVTDSAKKLVKKLYQITDKQMFFYCLYKNFINYPAIRPSVIVFIKTYYNRKDIYDLLIKDDSCHSDKIVKLSVKSFILAFKSNDSNLIKLSLELFSNIFNQKYPLMIFNYNNELVKYKISSEYKKLNDSLLVALIKVLLKRENILNNKVFEIFEEVKFITKLEDNIISDTLTIIFSEDVGVFIKLLHHFDNFNLILPTLLINLDKLNNDFITKKEDVKKIKEYIYNNSSEVYEIIVNNVIEIKYIEEILELINNNKIYLIVKRILCNRKSFVKNDEDGIIFNRIFLSYLNNENITKEEFNLTSEVYNLKNYEESEFYEYDMINLVNYTKKFNVESINRDFREILNILFLSNFNR
ncbi:DOP1 [Hepatospora eriocheir]|uniref:DOP1 n=1 Tax=Hepatospora eriocheir TaxID=1081669 RepID=A0A1X0QKA9_9MICR|nr:DOP1 [Hepatospora eriocheir]